MKIYDKVKIKTKKGIVEKYLSHYDSNTKTCYFMDSEDLMPPKTYYSKGTPLGVEHSFRNINLEDSKK